MKLKNFVARHSGWSMATKTGSVDAKPSCAKMTFLFFAIFSLIGLLNVGEFNIVG